MLVFGIDGGGTKTQCYIGDRAGRILGEGLGGPSNYQTCGMTCAKASIETAFIHALKSAQIKREAVLYGVLGLSGADEPVDYEVLEPMVKGLLGPIPHQIVNDTWIGLRSGAPFGVVSICGTGAGHAGVNEKGQQLLLRNMDYRLGNFGGGGELVEQGLHFAFRSFEGTYKTTTLENAVCRLLQVSDMDQVAMILRLEGLSEKVAYELPKIICQEADQGDHVAKMLLFQMGYEEGLYGAGILKRLKMDQQIVPMVLIGGLFKSQQSDLIQGYQEAVFKTNSNAHLVFPEKPPVYGAYLLAIEGARRIHC